MTITLLLTSEGKKMGKTEKGAVWLDPDKTSPYDFYQYWRNIEDVKVEECLGLLTFLPMEEVRRLGALKDAEINHAKDVLAFEITKIVHGEEEAQKAMEASKALFGGGMKSEDIPTTTYTEEQFTAGIDLITLLVDGKMAASRSDARRTIVQGGVTVNDVKITEFDKVFTPDDFDSDGSLLVRKGKKAYHCFKTNK